MAATPFATAAVLTGEAADEPPECPAGHLCRFRLSVASGCCALQASPVTSPLKESGSTCSPLATHRPWATDPTLLKEIPSEVSIHRTVTLDLPFGIKKRIRRLISGAERLAQSLRVRCPPGKPNFLKRALQDILLPDPQVTWLPVLTRAARRIIRERDIDLVLITVPPFSSALLVEKLRKEVPSPAHRHRLPRRMALDHYRSRQLQPQRARSRFARTAEASAVSERHRRCCSHRGRTPRDSRPVSAGARRQIPTHPERIRRHKAAPLRVLTGVPCPTGRSSSPTSALSMLQPSPPRLIQAVQSLPPEVKSRFKLRFIGHIEEPRFREALLQLGDMVELKGFLPQHEALAAMNETDYVLLIHPRPAECCGQVLRLHRRRASPFSLPSILRATRAACLKRCGQDGGRAVAMSKASASSSSTPRPAAIRCSVSFNPTLRRSRSTSARFSRSVTPAYCTPSPPDNARAGSHSSRFPNLRERDSSYAQDCGRHPVFPQLGGTMAGPVCLSDAARACPQGRCAGLLSQCRVSVLAQATEPELRPARRFL